MPPNQTPAPLGKEFDFHRQMSGDEHASKGLRYECAFRCIWLLRLRGTSTNLSVAEGEDVKISNGHTIFRQVKKRDVGIWHFSDLEEFVRNAFKRFINDRSVRHEFYTNADFQHSGSYKLITNGCLNSEYPGLQERLQGFGERGFLREFCRTVSFFPRQPSPERNFEEIERAVRKTIDKAFPRTNASELVSPSEISPIVDRLLGVEYGLWTEKRVVSWADVDAQLRFEQFISDLETRSMAGGALKCWREFVQNVELIADEEMRKGVEAVISGQAIARKEVEDPVLQEVKSWAESATPSDGKKPAAHYKVILLRGGHDSGKTWALLRLGSQISKDYDQLSVCVAVDQPPAEGYAFNGLALTQAHPCVVLIDDLFDGWEGLVSHINYPLNRPILFLTTAPYSQGDYRIESFAQRMGSRVAIVSVEACPREDEIRALGEARGVPIGLRERARIQATNFRHAIQIISGELPAKHLAGLKKLLQENSQHSRWLIPIFFGTAVGVPLPLEILEHYLQSRLPLDLKPWVVHRRKYGEIWVIFEDPREATVELGPLLPPSPERSVSSFCRGLLDRVEAENKAHRFFVRLLLTQLARNDPTLLSSLLETNSDTVDAVLTQEPLWALVFCWLPLFVDSRRADLIDRALSKVRRPPQTVAEISIFVEAFGADAAAAYLGEIMEGLDGWTVEPLVRFVEMVVQLPEEGKRQTASKLCKFLLDLPRAVLEECFSVRSCFEQVTSLIANHGSNIERERGVGRIGDVLESKLKKEESVGQNQVEGYINLIKRLVFQKRHRLSLEITKHVLLNRKMYAVRGSYDDCYLEDQRWDYRGGCKLGVRLLKDARANRVENLSRIPSNLLDLASSWAEEEDWTEVAENILGLLEELAELEVSFDRVSIFVLPVFSPIRRGPEGYWRRFLGVVLRWIARVTTAGTFETGKLIIKSLAFINRQTWLENDVREQAAEVLLSLVSKRFSTNAAQECLDRLSALIGRERIVIHPNMGLSSRWTEEIGQVNTYLAAIGNVAWNESQRLQASRSIAELWWDKRGSQQFMIEALLRLGSPRPASSLALRLVKAKPDYADGHGLLGIAKAQLGDRPEALARLSKIISIREKGGKGLRPHLANWLHRELARVSCGSYKTLHLICAELARNTRLRPYDEVIAESGSVMGE